MDDKDFYYDLSKFEAQMIATRCNFLLLFQSMLFAAVTKLADKATYIPQWLILSLGLLSSVVWLYINISTNVIFRAAIEHLTDKDDRLQETLNNSSEDFLHKIQRISWLMVYPFPVLTGIAWAILLYKYFT